MEKMGQGREGAADAKEKKATTTSKMREVRAEQRDLKRKAEDEALDMAPAAKEAAVADGGAVPAAAVAIAAVELLQALAQQMQQNSSLAVASNAAIATMHAQSAAIATLQQELALAKEYGLAEKKNHTVYNEQSMLPTNNINRHVELMQIEKQARMRPIKICSL